MTVHAENREQDAPKREDQAKFTIDLDGPALELLEEGMRFCLSIEDGRLVFSVVSD
jgi:hypothetical protein